MAEWVVGTVLDVTHGANNLFRLRLKAPINPFTAGQFTKLALDINGERLQRAYSFVNAPNDDCLEFYLITIPQGQLSPRLYQLKPSDQLYVTQQAAGFFVLDEIPDCQTLWMIASGTAIGPYLSILQYGQELERFNNIVLVHAVRYARDLSYLSLMNQLKQRYTKLKILTIVSREQHSQSLQGRIPELLLNGKLEEAVGLSINKTQSHVMLCGNPQMVADTRKLLKETRDMDKHLRRKPGHITSENYW